MTHPFYVLDVFADAPLQGNPLAVVLDADDLDSGRMQAIAGEFNLSETVFVLEPRDPVNTARVRIFTPGRELPFAGHPTVGTACLLAHLRAAAILARQDVRIVLEEPIGDVVCVARRRPGRGLAATFDLPRLPARLPGALPSLTEIAAAFSVADEDIGFGKHAPSLYSAGAPFLFVPIRSLEAIASARPGALAWPETPGPAAYLYAPEVERPGLRASTRECSPATGA